MASRREPGVQRRPRSSTKRGKSALTEKRPQGIKKKEPSQIRRSARLKDISRFQSNENRKAEQEYISSTADKVSQDRIVAQRLQTFKPSKLHPKRKRGQEAGYFSPQPEDGPPSKRPRTSPLSRATKEPQTVENGACRNNAYSLKTWLLTESWPREYFERDSQAGEHFFEHYSWPEEQMEQSSPMAVQYVEINGIKYPRPIRKAPTSLRRKQSDTSLTGSSDQKKRDSKSAAYRDTRYTTLLAAKWSYMEKSDLGITNTSLAWCKTLLNSEQTVPKGSLFRDDIFETTCRKVQDRNEARVIRSITPYIVPSVEDLETLGATQLRCLIENVNECWTGSIPVEGPRPQPDYSVGFRRSAFTNEQLNKLDPLIGTVYDTSFFVATYQMYFPFLTCEVKCGAAALDVADRQNAHSMTLAVRGVVELFRLVKREKELHREILAFSISHDHRTVRIYGHYPVIDGSKTTFYRHPIHTFDFTALEGKEKWTTYKFAKNVYDVWMLAHLERICSVIDQLPSDLDFEVQGTEASRLSKDLGGLSEPSNVESPSNQDNNESSPIVLQTETPDTSVCEVIKDQAPLKRPKRKHAEIARKKA
ncbi:hypothetical protein Egran_02197 [Elaphomyces granulatus]|uniref:DUF7924 domain-containing protein n=1 Tax=Elaphomyces granulatus TaxID=519963 RepID=A0A232M136_9EURO|nr:hypothetical protein Egran_02197 [Elaphomyces granulatus]